LQAPPAAVHDARTLAKLCIKSTAIARSGCVRVGASVCELPRVRVGTWLQAMSSLRPPCSGAVPASGGLRRPSPPPPNTWKNRLCLPTRMCSRRRIGGRVATRACGCLLTCCVGLATALAPAPCPPAEDGRPRAKLRSKIVGDGPSRMCSSVRPWASRHVWG